jgi:hypothetical protein
LLIIAMKHLVFSRQLIWPRLSGILVVDVLQALQDQV